MSANRVQEAAQLQQMFARAVSLHQQGDLDGAARVYRKLEERVQDHPDVLLAWGTLEGQRGNDKQAATLLERAVRFAPENPQAHGAYGNVLLQLNRPTQAVAAYDRALRLDPDRAQIHYNRGLALAKMQRFAEALASYEHAMIRDRGHADAAYGIGNVLMRLNRYREASDAFERATNISPSRADLWNNRGNALQNEGRTTEALYAYGRARFLAGDNAYFVVNESQCRLLIGDYVTAWPMYESRWQLPNVAHLARAFEQPQWNGAPLAGKTILLHAEQGFGDTLQFCRYVQLVAERGGRVVLEVQAQLVSLLGGMAGAHQVLARGDDLPGFDVHCPLLSLPMAFGTTLESIPAPVPYLRAPADRAAAWADRFGPKARPRVGVVWAGSGSIDNDQRSLQLADFARACDADVEFVGLQKEVRTGDREELARHPHIRNLELGDFADTAGAIEQLDLVLTVDTAVAHLAGALGKPVWILLAFAPTWRWLLGRDDSPWYPTARLFRQPEPGNWHEPLARVRAALGELR
jgi:tetratricopeptide (TPR) repeat protein